MNCLSIPFSTLGRSREHRQERAQLLALADGYLSTLPTLFLQNPALQLQPPGRLVGQPHSKRAETPTAPILVQGPWSKVSMATWLLSGLPEQNFLKTSLLQDIVFSPGLVSQRKKQNFSKITFPGSCKPSQLVQIRIP